VAARWAAFAASAAVAALAGCGGGSAGEEVAVVFSAASLAAVAAAVDPGATVVAGGSNDLAAQIRDGARADVFLSASEAPLAQLREAGLVRAPVPFASNRLVVVVPRANPARIGRLADLRRPGTKLVLGAEGVPVGDYAREALAAAGLHDALENVVSLEDDVKGVVGKVALGEADAGVVYATDARAAGDRVSAVPVPAAVQPEIRYLAAATTSGGARAEAYLERLLGDAGAAALRDGGFLPLR
jgi:molybdate transport system substrate-binding protein